MARTKRTSSILDTAKRRLAGLKSITPEPNFGTTLTPASFEADMKAVNDKLDTYNQELSSIDQTLNELQSLEKVLADKNTRILAATKATYGPDSSEYEQVGGTRTSERKRPGPRKTSKGTGATP